MYAQIAPVFERARLPRRAFAPMPNMLPAGPPPAPTNTAPVVHGPILVFDGPAIEVERVLGNQVRG